MKRMSFFFFLFCLILSQQVLIALEVVSGLAFSLTDVKFVSGTVIGGNKRVKQMVTDEPMLSGSSTM